METTQRIGQQVNLRDLFLNLTDDNHEITSPRTIEDNCIAWAAQNTRRWWQPGGQANVVSSKTSRIQAQMRSKTAITVTSFHSCADQSNRRQMILSSNFRICFGPTRRSSVRPHLRRGQNVGHGRGNAGVRHYRVISPAGRRLDEVRQRVARPVTNHLRIFPIGDGYSRG